jgi:hypothetical protein
MTDDDIEARRKRRKAIEFGIASARLSGFILDEWALEQHQLFVDGKITSEHMRENALLRYKVGHAEMREREKSIEIIVGSDRLEGIEHAPHTLEMMRRYVAGEITIDECLEDVRDQLRQYQDSLR